MTGQVTAPQTSYTHAIVHQQISSEQLKSIRKAAMDVPMLFGSTRLCEKTFSALTYITNKYRSRLKVEDDLLVAVSKIKPRTDSCSSIVPTHLIR